MAVKVSLKVDFAGGGGGDGLLIFLHWPMYMYMCTRVCFCMNACVHTQGTVNMWVSRGQLARVLSFYYVGPRVLEYRLT